MYHPKLRKYMKLSVTLLIIILALSSYFVAIVLLLYLSDVFTSDDNLKNLQWANLPVIIPAILNVVLLLSVEDFFDNLATRLTNYENH